MNHFYLSRNCKTGAEIRRLFFLSDNDMIFPVVITALKGLHHVADE